MKYYSFEQIALIGFILFSLDVYHNITVGSSPDHTLYTLHGNIEDGWEEFVK